MRKIIILIGIFLMFLGVRAQQPQTQSNLDPNMKKGVLRTGSAKNGCDTSHFVDRPGQFYDLPKVDRRGKRLKFHLNLVNKVMGCGTSDEEALLQVTIHWQSDTTDFMPKIVERGVKYWYDPDFDPPAGQSLGTVFHKIDESLDDDCSCDSVFYVLLDGLTPGTHYVTRAYVIKYSPNPSSADTLESQDLLITHEREKCTGWKKFANEVADGSGIELVYDHEGNDYGVTQIGNQCWLRENLRCSTSPKGYLLQAPVNYVTGDTIYYKVSEQVPYYYVFEGLTISDRQRGNLYNWVAVVDSFGAVPKLPQGHRRGLCPEGWHVPNNEEWYELVDYVLDLGHKTLADFHNEHDFIGDSVVKFSFGCGWPTDAQNGTHYSDANPGGYMDDAHVYLRNTTGFAAMPTNNVQETGRLGYVKEGSKLTNVANYWLGSPSETNSTFAYSWHIDEDQRGVSSFARTRKRGFSLRCLRDALTITLYPNTPQICLNDQVTYTPKVANEYMPDFVFKWKVIDKNGIVPPMDFMTTGDHPSFVFQPVETGNYRIECNAIRGNSMSLLDSVFVEVTECPYLTISPNVSKICIGETVTVMAHTNEIGNMKWSVNDISLEGENETTLTYTFPTNQTEDDKDYTFKFYVDGVLRGSISILVNKVLPSLSICPDCDRNGFVIKGSKNMSNNTLLPYARWYMNTPQGDSTVTYAHAVNTVVPADPGASYSVAMVSTGGCHDTIKGLVLTPKNTPCEPLNGILANETPDGNGKIVSVEDHEHNRYAVTQIGNRCWMSENMRAISSPTKTNGQYDTILARNVSVGNTAYQSYVSQTAHWYRNDSATYSKFGLLYNWCAAADVYQGTKVATGTSGSGTAWTANLADNWRGICPEGWHLPSVQDWREMEDDVFGNTDKAGRLAGGCDWSSSDVSNSPGRYYRSTGDDWGSSGFNALPSGDFVFNNGDPKMENVNAKARYWTSKEASASKGYYRGLYYNGSPIERSSITKNSGLSVRCVRNIPNWPPVMTVCYGVDPGVININTYENLDSVAWCRSDGYTVSCKLSESHQATLQPGKYAVKLFNNINPSLCHVLDSITINTVCKVQSVHPTEHPYASGYIDAVSDMSDNSYPVVEINGQCWMRTNMRTIHDNQGNPLEPGGIDCYKGTPNANRRFYYDVCMLEGRLPLKYRGYLYNWNTAHVICPEGWHLPSIDEWKAVSDVYSNKTAMLAGDCSQYWGNGHNGDYTVANYNVENRNITGFSLVAAGNMDKDGNFGYTSINTNPSANLWAEAASGTTTSRVVFDYNQNTLGTRKNDDTKRAFSVRCIRDEE